jgi:signal transduction histidine kinase/predicted RNA-binding protein with RPS1 domain/DNA-binding response OmpR family regulator
MKSRSESTKIRQGDKVKVKVIKLASSGVVVQIQDDSRGIIRNRELSWKRTLDASGPVVAVGDELDALVLQVGHPGDLWELSLKQASGDPWDKVMAGKYRTGSIVSGEVVNLEHYGAFVELEPGIDGLLHRLHIPGGQESEIQDLVWIGDQIEAVITAVDRKKRHISLSITEHLNKRRHIETRHVIGKHTALDHRVRAERLPSLYASEWMSKQQVCTILLVDNDTECTDEFAGWLRRLGYQVDTAEGETEASRADSAYNLVFLDLELGDTDGFKVAEQMLCRNPQTDIVIMTGMDCFEQGVKAVEDAKVSAVLLKPLDYGEVLQVLHATATGRLTKSQVTTTRDQEPRLADRILADQQEHEEIAEKLTQVLEALRAESGASAALVFEVDPSTHRIAITAASGVDTTRIEQAELQSLRFSPVRNVALDKECLQDTDAPNQNKFEKLLRLFFFESCVAAPVLTLGRDACYALFLLDPNNNLPLSIHLTHARSAAYFVATIIREERVRSILRAAQKSILIGQLASGLLHELRNHIGRIEQYARNLELDCHELEEAPRASPLVVWSDRLQKRVEGILDTNAALRGILSEHLGLMGKEKTGVVDINTLLDKAARQVAPLARENRVKVIPQLDARLPHTVAVPLHLEQVFLNLALNAVQQMGAQIPKGGDLKIASQYNHQDADLPIKIRFSDQGPGIHRSLWDWIFEMGASTRDGGTGLGLFISKSLIQGIGGTISVEQSRMFVGSTLLIELPVVEAKEAGDA